MHSVLIVENEEKWRDIFSEALRAKGYRVEAVETWEEADNRLKGNGQFDVLLLNLHLLTKRDFLAVKVLESVCRYCPLTPCIIISGSLDQLIRGVGRYRDQVFELLSKADDPQGFDLNVLYDTIKRAIQERVEVTQRSSRATLEARLTQHRSNLDKLQEQKAFYGAGEEPLALLNKIEAEEQAIAELKACLAERL